MDDVADHLGLPRPLTGGHSAAPEGAAQVGDIGRHGVGVVAVGRLLDTALRRAGIRPDAVAGHSVGEWTAMIAGGLYAGDSVDAFLDSFDPDSLLVPGLAFGALGAPAERVLDALATVDGMAEVVLSHDNAPQQSIVCGPQQPVTELVHWFRARGVLGQVLPFRSGFHTPMLAPYLDPIRQAADRFELHRPTVPVWSGTTASPLVEAMYAAGFRAFVQVGTGQLASLVSDTLGERAHLAVPANSPHRAGLDQLRRVAAALWVDGSEPEPAALLPAIRVRAHPAVPLDLGGALVSLDPAALGPLRAALAREPRPTAGLSALADRFPMAAELGALLRDTERAAVELIGAGGRAAPLRAPLPPPPPPLRSKLHISTATMPYLLDHCFIRQRPGWPDLVDRWPVVPATTIVQHLLDAAERAAPGQLACGATDLRFGQWVPAATPLDVEITLEPAGPGRFTAAFGGFAGGTVELADRYAEPPTPWRVETADEREPELTAAGLYEQRWMFHGPRFQGLTELTALGTAHVRGVITAPSAPGALLDNVGQLLGYWIMATRTERTVVFPVGIRRLRLHGPMPRAGSELDCHIRITSLTDTMLEAEVQLLQRGVVWAEIQGWQDRRFDSHPDTRPVERFVERHTLAKPQPGGWMLLHERWPDLASRDLIMRNHLGTAERARYEQQPPRGRRAWLLGRIAVKDAVRQWLAEQGEPGVFPAEIEVRNDPAGRPWVAGLHGRTLPPLDVSLAHHAEAAVALVRPAGSGGSGVGIDLVEITERPAETLAVALGPAEAELLAACRAEHGGSEALWFARFWAAKEAVAKAEGTGLRGRPREFAVVAAQPSALRVTVGPRMYRLHCTEVGSPPGLPDRSYVVAWTTADDSDERTAAK